MEYQMQDKGPDGPEPKVPDNVTMSDDGKEARIRDDGQGNEEKAPKKWADKFDSPEAMEKAYKELQSKLGLPKTETKVGAENEAEEAPAEAKTPESKDGKIGTEEKAPDEKGAERLGLDAVVEELSENEGLSDETYTRLEEERGMSRQDVDAWVAGQQALADRQLSELQEAAGGAEEFNSLIEWAKTGLDAAEAKAYDAAIDQGNTALAKMLLRGMKAQYVAANGQDPNLVRGENVPQTRGVKPFSSNDEMVEAMSNPKYKTNAAYRQQVFERIKASG